MHITGWCDQAAPPGTEQSIIAETLELTKKRLGEGENVAIHCHAGVGRTGTFMAMLELMVRNDQQRGVEGRNRLFSVFETVRRLREGRKGMVYTAEQYEFLYSWAQGLGAGEA